MATEKTSIKGLAEAIKGGNIIKEELEERLAKKPHPLDIMPHGFVVPDSDPAEEYAIARNGSKSQGRKYQ